MRILAKETLSPHKYRTKEGYLICVDAILARTGSQIYRKCELYPDSDDWDTEIAVDRTPAEVFSPQTLASFENKPVTMDHPDTDVNPGNYKELAVGFTRDIHKGKTLDGEDVILGTLVITDQDAITAILDGDHVELSCGYDCQLVGDDRLAQTNIRGNHVALCEKGRAGIARIVDSVSDAPLKRFALMKVSEWKKKGFKGKVERYYDDFKEAKQAKVSIHLQEGTPMIILDLEKQRIADEDVKFTYCISYSLENDDRKYIAVVEERNIKAALNKLSRDLQEDGVNIHYCIVTQLVKELKDGSTIEYESVKNNRLDDLITKALKDSLNKINKLLRR